MLSAESLYLLQKLDKNEILRLGKFIKSPYLNSIKILEKMYEEIVKHYPKFKSGKLAYKSMWKKLYPEKEYNDKIIRNLYTQFSKLLKRFIGYEEIGLNEDTLKLNTIEGLNRKQCFDAAERMVEKSKKDKGADFKLGPENFYYFYRLNNQYFTHMEYIRYKTTEDYYNATDSQAENFISFFLGVVLNYGASYLIMKKNYGLQKPDTFREKFFSTLDIEKFVNLMDDSSHKYTPYLKVRYLIYKYAHEDISQDEYYELKKLITDNIHKFEKNEALAFFYTLQDIVQIKLMPNDKSKDKKMTRELFELGKLFCSLNLYNRNSTKPFEVYTLRNFYTVAFLVKEYEWADNYLEEYVNYLKPELRENEYNYGKAMISFKFKKYEDSLNYISKFETKDIIEKFTIRLFSLMNYIELGAYEAAISMIASIRQFISESKEIPESRELSMHDSLKFFSEVIKSITSGKKLDYAVYKEAKSTPKFFQRQYILEKMECMV